VLVIFWEAKNFFGEVSPRIPISENLALKKIGGIYQKFQSRFY
jgi:hypothetical protein